MKRFILVLVLILSVSGLFAKDKVVKDKAFYEKKYDVSVLGFYESSNLEVTNGYKYYIAIYDFIADDETVAYQIFCNDYEKIKDYFYRVREKGLSLKKPYFHFYVDACALEHEFTQNLQLQKEIVNIEEVYKKKDFGSDRKTIFDFHVFILE